MNPQLGLIGKGHAPTTSSNAWKASVDGVTYGWSTGLVSMNYGVKIAI
jgi:hypothetical protein